MNNLQDIRKYLQTVRSREEAFLLSSDGVVKDHAKGTSHSVQLDPTLIRKDDYLTHNHPNEILKSKGAGLSMNDILVAVSWNMSGIEAVLIDGNILICRRPQKGWPHVTEIYFTFNKIHSNNPNSEHPSWIPPSTWKHLGLKQVVEKIS